MLTCQCFEQKQPVDSTEREDCKSQISCHNSDFNITGCIALADSFVLMVFLCFLVTCCVFLKFIASFDFLSHVGIEL